MQVIDITRTLSEGMATYPLNPPYAREVLRDVPEASSSLSKITLGTHSGTHVDAPRHVFKDGAGIERVSLRALIGSAVVLDLTSIERVISADDLRQKDIPPDHVVLLKTRNSAADHGRFDQSFIACDEHAARYLTDQKARAVGIDGPSIKKFQVSDQTHQLLLERGIPIIEGLDLSRASAGLYTFLCLPLPLEGADGAPARAVLLEKKRPGIR